jgi:hypothetical protein
MLQPIKKRDSRAVSVMIGYVLLVSLAIIMGGIIYTWMKTYVPKDALECPEGTSLIIKSYSYNCSNPSTMNITLKNNGRFNVGGFFIHISNNENVTLPTLDISTRANEDFGGYKFQSSLIFKATNNNTFTPGEEINVSFDKDLEDLGRIHYVQVIPTRWQHQENILRYVSCGTVSTHKEEVNC